MYSVSLFKSLLVRPMGPFFMRQSHTMHGFFFANAEASGSHKWRIP